jgi:uncharacterized phage protein (TIGR02218 family)
MRALGTEFAAHLAQVETTTAQCWRLVRRDGEVLGFTDHDRDILVDGTLCSPVTGLEGSEMPSRLGAQVETGDVLGVLASEAITEDDILLGKYDGARVETFSVNWAEPNQFALLRVDTIGEIVREDGVFRAELRSPQQALNVVRGRIYQSLCDAEVGDTRCGVDIETSVHKGEGVVAAIIDPFQVLVEGVTSFEEGWFNFGIGTWTSGKRNGLRDAVLSHRRTVDGDVLGFASRITEWLEVGDSFAVTVGCDRRFSTCKSRFGNAENFRGCPHVPGSDYVLRHPRRGYAMDGRAVVP